MNFDFSGDGPAANELQAAIGVTSTIASLIGGSLGALIAVFTKGFLASLVAAPACAMICFLVAGLMTLWIRYPRYVRERKLEIEQELKE